MLNTKTNNNEYELIERNNISNPNILINSNFKINQRGKSSYSISPGSAYTVDRWKLWNGTLTVNDDYSITIENTKSNENCTLVQILNDTINEECTASLYVKTISGACYMRTEGGNFDGDVILKEGLNTVNFSGVSAFSIFLKGTAKITVKYAKLERGSIATPYVEPDPVEELNKCAAYYCFYNCVQIFYGEINQVYMFSQSFITRMRTKPTCTITSTSSLYGTSSSSISFNWCNDVNFQYKIKCERTASITANIIIEANAEIY